MIYVVSGYMRTGTSMMMQALEAGGLEVVHDKARTKRMVEQNKDDHYNPNAGGLYELNARQYRSLGFPEPEIYEGKLIKNLLPGVLKMVAGEYRVIFMVRNPEEARQSFKAFFKGGNPPLHGEDYARATKETIGILRMRRDIDLTVVDYRNVVDYPLDLFEMLGWPIDPEKAAAVVDPEKCRYRIEGLEIGV